MKLSIETYALRRRYDDFEAARLIREAGFDCVDYSCYYWKEQAHALEDGYREYARALRTHLDGLGLVCNQSHAPFDTKYGQPFAPSCLFKNFISRLKYHISATFLNLLSKVYQKNLQMNNRHKSRFQRT